MAMGRATPLSFGPATRVRLALVVNERDATGDVYAAVTVSAPAARPSKA
jgi:hypothetical protein